jgi:hypothetical protein
VHLNDLSGYLNEQGDASQPASYSRCQFQLGLMSDITAVAPRNRRWNRFVCNSQLNASATLVDVDVWPLVSSKRLDPPALLLFTVHLRDPHFG